MREALGRILYVAVADARGHLMRGHLVRRLLAPRGVEVELVTTSHEGVAFLEGLGSPSRLLSEHFQVEFDARHDMRKGATDRRVTAYLLNPGRGLRDLWRLRDWARGCDLVVNDSLHPALLMAPWGAPDLPVVQVYGENLRRAAESNFDGRAPASFIRAYRSWIRSAFAQSMGEIVHCVGAPLDAAAGPSFHLPTLVPPLSRSRAEVRSALGLAAGEKLVAAYLNPHFRDERIARAVESALPPGFRLYGVGEGYPGRPGWRGQDGAFAEVVAAADVFLSGAGMGALELSRSTGTPMLALLGAQPEQERNAEAALAALPDGAFACVSTAREPLGPALGEQLALLARARFLPPVSPGAIETAWADAFTQLIQLTRKEPSDEADRRIGVGDAQLEGGRSRHLRRGQSRAVAGAPQGAERAAG